MIDSGSNDEKTGSWLVIFAFCIIGSFMVSWLMIDIGHGNFAKAIFLWMPFALIVATKLAEPFLKKFLILNDVGQWVIRKRAPKAVAILLKMIPIMAMLMVGYGFAHLIQFGTI